MRRLFLAWQDPDSRRWFPVGRLSVEGGSYRFDYTHGAHEAQSTAGFAPLPSFPDLEKVYRSETLFPLFANRVLSENRPDYADFVTWLSIPTEAADPFALLARSGGRRQTDTLEVFPEPEIDATGNYQTRFFVRGLRYFGAASLERANRLENDERLLLQHDMQNPEDKNALLLRPATDYQAIGYLPRYLAEDILLLLNDDAGRAMVTVERVNTSPAPVQFRVLCRLILSNVGDFRPFGGKIYQPIEQADK